MAIPLARALNGYGRLLTERGDLQRAIPMHAEAVEIVRTFRETHPQLPTYLINYGIQLCTVGRFEDAQAVLDEALSRTRQAYPDGHLHVAAALNALGVCQFKAGRYGLAEASFRESASMLQSLVEADHDWTLVVSGNLGRVLLRQERFVEAESLILRVLEGRRRRFGGNGREMVKILGVLAELRFEQGAAHDALSLVEEAVAVSSRGFGARHPMTALTQIILAQLRLRHGRPGLAETDARRALSTLRRAYGRGAPDALHAQMLLGASLARQGNGEAAQALLQEVCKNRKRRYGEASWQLAEAQVHLANAFTHVGRRDEARVLLNAARRHFAKQRGYSHWLTRLASSELSAMS